MDAKKVEELEKKMLDRFYGVDQKLATIEQLLRNMIDDQMWGPRGDKTSRDCSNAWMGQQESESGKKNGPCFGFGYKPDERFGQKVVRVDKTENNTEIVKTGQDDKVADRTDAPASDGFWASWKKKNEPCFGFSYRPDDRFGQKEVRVDETEKNTEFVKTGQDDKVADKTDKTDGLLEDSLKADQRVKNDSGSWAKLVQKADDLPQNEMTAKSGNVESEKGDNKPQVQIITQVSNEKAHEKSEKPGSLGLKNHESCDKKRKRRIKRQKLREKKKLKRLNLPAVQPDDGARLSGPFTVTRQRFDMFTSDELQILTDVEPVMQSIQRIMHQNGYKDGDPLSADDQTYILDNVFDYHPDKAQKMSAGLDYIMVTKHTGVQECRCFYIVLDGHKEEFSYEKCLENFVRGKYPDKVDEFMPKYFMKPQSCPTENRDRGSVPDEAGSQSGWNVAGSVYFVKPSAHKVNTTDWHGIGLK